MFNFVPFKLLINVHSKLSTATTIGKICPGHNSRKDSNIKERKSKICPSSKFLMLTGVFRKRSLRGNRSGNLRMKWVVWLKCISSHLIIHTLFNSLLSLQNVWGIIVWLHTEVLASPPALSLGKKPTEMIFRAILESNHINYFCPAQKIARKKIGVKIPSLPYLN